MTMLSKPRVLIISDQSVNFSLPDTWEALQFSYSFSDEPSPDGFSAWKQDPSHFFVAKSCKNLAGGFALQALNRPVLQLALKQKIDGVLLIGLYGCTIDLPRIFSFLGIPVVWALQPDVKNIETLFDRFTAPWLRDAFSHVTQIYGPSLPFDLKFDPFYTSRADFISTFNTTLCANNEAQLAAYDYSLYEFGLRDHPLLQAMQSADVRHFDGCNRVLDLGCGSGIFLSLLELQGIAACGVERNDPIACYARGMGLDVITADAVKFAAETDLQFDGIYCSHFVEHLPVELVEKLLASLARVVEDDGVVVLTFPDPESIRSQLLGFWRDPEHVRFYHPELIISLASAVGLDLIWSSYDEQPHRVVSFPSKPERLAELTCPEPISSTKVKRRSSLFDNLLRKLLPDLHGTVEQLQAMQEQVAYQSVVIEHQQVLIEQLAARTDKLWDVNQTWAWNDNVTLKFKRRTR